MGLGLGKKFRNVIKGGARELTTGIVKSSKKISKKTVGSKVARHLVTGPLMKFKKGSKKNVPDWRKKELRKERRAMMQDADRRTAIRDKKKKNPTKGRYSGIPFMKYKEKGKK